MDNLTTKATCMQGDDYQPSGTLTGGSRRQERSTLAKVAELGEIEAQLHTLKVRNNEQPAHTAASRALHMRALVLLVHLFCCPMSKQGHMKSHPIDLTHR